MPNEVRDQVPGAVTQVFIRAPKFADEELYARIYAQANGFAIAPTLACTAEMIQAGPGAFGAAARIANPTMGSTVSGTVFVTGTASWAAGQAQFYKMEIRGPQFPNWTTFSSPSGTPVINGPLGDFGSAGLMPGMYEIRIVIVGMDSNHLLESIPVALNVTGQ